MASGGEPMPPTGGRCGACASAKPAATTLITPPKMAVRIDHAPMLAAPLDNFLAAILQPCVALCKEDAGLSTLDFNLSGGLDSEIVDQPRFAKSCRDQDSHRAVLERGDRRQRPGMPGLEIVDDETGMGD